MSTKYADVKVERLEESAHLSMSYGGAVFDEVGRGFSEIDIDGSYTDFKIGVEDGAAYKLDASGNYASTRYPDAMDIHKEIDKGTHHEVQGYFGGSTTKNVIKVRMSYGGLKITD